MPKSLAIVLLAVCYLAINSAVLGQDTASSTDEAVPSPSPSEISPPSAEQWLQRLSDLVNNNNFEASFVLYRAGQETQPYLWRHGIMPDGTHMEQLNLQNGPGREFIRVGQQVSVFEPETVPYTVPGRSINGPIPWALLHNESQLYDGYEFVVVGRSRIAGRKAQQIRIVSQDNTRFRYRLWLDDKTGMLLRLIMIDNQGNVIEQIQMANFAVSEQPHPYFTRVNQAKLPAVLDIAPRAVQHQWQLGFLPVGMREVKQDNRRLAGTGQYVEHKLYSDGLVDVSVYVESADNSLNKDVLLRHGLSTFLSRQVGGTQITIIGEIPGETANAMAASLTVVPQ